MRTYKRLMMLLTVVLVTAVGLWWVTNRHTSQGILPPEGLNASQWQLAQSMAHRPSIPKDPSNRYARDDNVKALGKLLFFSKALSRDQDIACASCHQRDNHWIDTVQFAKGIAEGDKNTPSLWNVAYNRWFFGDGRADSLWSQALKPIENPLEMGSNRLLVLHRISQDKTLFSAFMRAFGDDIVAFKDSDQFPASGSPTSPPIEEDPTNLWQRLSNPQQHFVNALYAKIGKAIAAFETDIVSPASPFELFVRRIEQGEAQLTYPASAVAGFKLFTGKGGCVRCHFGPLFTSGEFHNIRLPLHGGGRYQGIRQLMKDEFNLAGPYSDAPDSPKLKYLKLVKRNWGEFKVPSLRNVSKTAPYMHDGRFVDLRRVIDFYSELKTAIPDLHVNETLIVPLNFTDQEKHNLLSFLQTI